MQIQFIDNNNYHYLNDIRTLIEQSDKEFIPPLSFRKSTTQQSLYIKTNHKASCDAYFEQIKSQYVMVALGDNQEVIGFMSFKKNYSCEHIKTETFPNIYVTTIIVSQEYRKHGVANSFYERLKDDYPECNLFTRTWSSNQSHIGVLKTQGFSLHHTIKNDRGEGIDTFYFVYEPRDEIN